MLKPYNIPAAAHNVSPIPQLEYILNEIPFNISTPARHIRQEKIVTIFGFFLSSMYIKMGTEMQDKFSKKAYFAGVVYKSPIFWLILASAKNIPVSTPGKI